MARLRTLRVVLHAPLLAVVSCASGSTDSVFQRSAPEAAMPATRSPPGSTGAFHNAELGPPAPAQPQANPAEIDLPAGACVATGTIEASLRPTNVLFLIDRSASMSCNLPPITSSAACEVTPERADPNAPSKWEIVRAALEAAIAALPPSVRAGITYFSNDDECGVQSRPHVAMAALDAEQVARLGASLDEVVPRGGTPIVGGMVLAFKQLNPDQTPDVPGGNRFVVLLTDGQEGCAPEQTGRLLQTEMPKAHTAAITTFVIGVPGSEVSRAFLSQLALAGGTASSDGCDHTSSDPTVGDCHFDMSENPDLAAGLAGALAAISGRTLSCEFDVPLPSGGGVLDHDKVNVIYKEAPGQPEQLIGQDARLPCEDGANGWQYNTDKSKILICGDACARVRRAASINIALGCESFRVQ